MLVGFVVIAALVYFDGLGDPWLSQGPPWIETRTVDGFD
jgi:hypothetical protein